jgi:hypothetical protein
MPDRDRFSDEYDPEPDYDRPTRAEAEADARDDFAPIPPTPKKEQTVSSDPTETARREMLATGQPAADLAAELGIDGPTWTTETVSQEFEIIGFMAPFVVARRRSDGVKGSLEFTHSPRVYFNFQSSE